jgi:hypothetical protein
VTHHSQSSRSSSSGGRSSHHSDEAYDNEDEVLTTYLSPEAVNVEQLGMSEDDEQFIS